MNRSTIESKIAPIFEDLLEIRAKLPSTPSQISENTRKIGAQIELEVRYTKMPKIKPKKVKEFGVTPILESGFVTE